MHEQLHSRFSRQLAVLAVLPFLAIHTSQAATTYDNKVKSTSMAWSAGKFEVCEKESQARYAKGLKEVSESSKSSKSKKTDESQGKPGEESKTELKGKDAILNSLEYGTALRAREKYAESTKVLDEADKRLAANELEAKTKVSREFVTLLTSEADTPYRGYAFDGIMVNTYKVLNFLMLSNVNDARVELNRAVQRQIDAGEINKKRIEAAQQKMDEDKDKKEKATKVMESDQFKSQVSAQYSVLDTLKAYKDYENPFTVYLDALFFMANAAAGGADVERSRKSFERVNAFVPENQYVAQDLKAMEAFLTGTPVPPTTFVIFETGSALTFKETKFELPTFVGNGSVPVAFPVPKLNDNYAKGLAVTAAGKTENTSLLSSMDSVIGLEVKKELPGLIRKTIMSTTSKGALDYAGKQGGVFGSLAAMAFNHLVTRADCRSWYMLPKEFQLCRVATPADRKIDISLVGGGQKSAVTVNPGHFNIVYVRSTSASAPLNITQITLKP